MRVVSRISPKISACRLAALAIFLLVHGPAMAAELAGNVQCVRSPVAGATILLNAAGEGAPAKLAQGKTDANGAFKLSFGPAPKGSVLYLVAKGGVPKVAEAKAPNDAIALLAVLGSFPPNKVTVNEFTTIASVR